MQGIDSRQSLLGLLIDADVTLFQAASAAEVETDWGDGLWTLHSDTNEALRIFNSKVAQYSDELGAPPILCFSDPTRRCFRHDLCPTYKANRKGTRKPLAYAHMRDGLSDIFKIVTKPGLEADDTMGIISTRAPGRYIIVSIDKDMSTVPGFFYRTNVPNPKVEEISIAQADYRNMIQTLTGDPVDGYGGCPGVGVVGAAKVVELGMPPSAMWKAVVAAFKKAKLTEADALLQARMARILRCSEWDFDKSEVKLWRPPT